MLANGFKPAPTAYAGTKVFCPIAVRRSSGFNRESFHTTMVIGYLKAFWGLVVAGVGTSAYPS